MATVSAQVTNVRTKLKSDPNAKVISDANIVQFLNDAQDILESEIIFPEAQVTESLSLTASTQTNTLATNWRKSVMFRYGANDRVLREIPFIALQKRDDAGKGKPEEYAIFGESVYWSPIPSATEASAVTHFYIKELDTLVQSGAGSGETATSELPRELHHVIEYGALMMCFQLIGDDKRAEMAEDKWLEGIERSKKNYMSNTNDYDSQLFTASQAEGSQIWRFSPYSS